MKGNIIYKDIPINFEIEYKKRKTFAIEIIPPNKIKVKSPRGILKSKIEELVHSKANWIIKKLEEFKDIEHMQIERRFVDGEIFMYLGKEYILKITQNKNLKKAEVSICNEFIHVKTPKTEIEIIKKIMIEWYKIECDKKIRERIEVYGQKLGEMPRIIKVKEQKRRWGTCTSRRDVLFNWKCIMAPIDVIDYIVVHELCHLVHMNHSANFWSLVKLNFPHYEEKKQWLRKNGIKMEF